MPANRDRRALFVALLLVLTISISGTVLGSEPVKRAKTGLDAEPTFTPPPLHERAKHPWPFATGPVYGDAPSGRRREGLLLTQVGAFDLADGFSRLPAALRYDESDASHGSCRYWVVQLRVPQADPLAGIRTRDRVKESGGAVIAEIPVAAFLARLDPATVVALRGASEVLRVEPYHPALKLSPSIGRTPLPDLEAALSDFYDLDITVFPGEDPQLVAATVEDLGG